MGIYGPVANSQGMVWMEKKSPGALARALH